MTTTVLFSRYHCPVSTGHLPDWLDALAGGKGRRSADKNNIAATNATKALAATGKPGWLSG